MSPWPLLKYSWQMAIASYLSCVNGNAIWGICLQGISKAKSCTEHAQFFDIMAYARDRFSNCNLVENGKSHVFRVST